MFWV
jgi:predicted RND superfamily exporter protein